MSWALALALLQPAAAPAEPALALRLVELRLAARHADALRLLEQNAGAVGGDPVLGFARGDLLERTGRLEEAHDSFVELLATDLAPFARFRLARLQQTLGHPEVAAGLLATLLATRPPVPLAEPAADLFADALAEGGDCRLAEGADRWPLEGPSRRRLTLVRAECRLAAGDLPGGRTLLQRLLDEDLVDGQALAAAERLLALAGGRPGALQARQIGLALYHQRAFAEAVAPLRIAARTATAGWEVPYALARSSFWLRRYDEAVTQFEALLPIARTAAQRADALFQQGRCHELAGRWPDAVTSYRRAHEADPTGEWAAAALLARLRLLWRQGDEAGALEIYARLGERGSWSDTRAQTERFLAASDLVRGRRDRAGLWLDRAASRSAREEVEYWRGRLAELEGREGEAIRRYGAALVEEPFGPFAAAARERLAAARLAPLVPREASALAATGTERDLQTAWLLRGNPEGGAARDRLREALARSPETRAALTLAVRPPERWPQPPSGDEPARRLAAVGFWGLDPEGLQRRFPLDDPELAMTRAAVLAAAGDTTGSLRAAEVLARGLPDRIPSLLRPLELRRLLYPLPYLPLVEREARARRVDRWLLFALMREESRFDARAVSQAAARGLTQFVLPTARRFGPTVGRAALAADDLHDPAVAIALGAAYLEDLAARFAGRSHLMLAAYNAGEEQAALWQSYCHSREPAEYLTKIGFRQTRDYVRRVLTSHAHYRELYGE